MKTHTITSKYAHLAVASLLAIGICGTASAGETIEHAGVKFSVSDSAPAKSKGEYYEHAGVKFQLSKSISKKKTAKTYEHAGQKFAELDK